MYQIFLHATLVVFSIEIVILVGQKSRLEDALTRFGAKPLSPGDFIKLEALFLFKTLYS